MKILYGVQGTGNGHITRARAMAKELQQNNIEVDYLFSGRAKEQLFDMQAFGDYLHRDGLTFSTREGQIQVWDTLKKARTGRFLRDVQQLPVLDYDLILTDYEPVTAWAGKLRGVKVVGLGHQYAFHHAVPQVNSHPGHRLLLHYFAPAQLRLGLHWHHFAQPILPPMAPVDTQAARCEPGRLLVYLPFESPDAITRLLAEFDNQQFYIFHPQADQISDRHQLAQLHWHNPSRNGFEQQLLICDGVICNAGFELVSETLQLGKKILVKPLNGQPEQQSNALALDILGYSQSMQQLDTNVLADWLTHADSVCIDYPNVAQEVCHWLLDGARAEEIQQLSAKLWAQTRWPQAMPDNSLPASAASL